ncbi:MAG: FHA domain-containing protein [Chloroflexi bacterium]|nr:FHA domain-containing protein [Chloroflexota bacterium]
MLGRESDAGLVVPLATMSRRQGRLAWDGARFLFENLSTSNVSRIDGAAVAGVVPLGDGMRIEAGGTVLRFHDLAAGDRVSGPVCSHCGRENRSGDPECWFCGTSLVNAVTSVRRKRRVELRLIGETGDVTDLLDGMVLAPRSGGGWDAVATEAGPRARQPRAWATPAVALDDGRPRVVDETTVTIEAANKRPEGGEPAVISGQLSTGDRLIVAGHQYVAVVRNVPDSAA